MTRYKDAELQEFTDKTATIADLKQDLKYIAKVVFKNSLDKGVTQTTINIDLLHHISEFLDLFTDIEE